MTRLREVLACACLLALLAILGAVAYLTVRYGPESCAAAKDTLVHGKGLVTELQRAAKRSVQTSDDTDTAVKHLNETLGRVDEMIKAAKGAVTASGETIKKLGATADGATALEDATAKQVKGLVETRAKADAAIDAITGALAPVPDAISGLTALEHSIDGMVTDPKTAELRDNVSALAANGATLAGNSATAVQHFDARYLAPYSGNHPRWHRAWTVTGGLVGLSAHGAEGAYYFSNIH